MYRHSSWTEVENNPSRIDEISKFLKKYHFYNKSFKDFILEKHPNFFDNSKNPIYDLGKRVFSDPADEGELVDKYFCYLVKNNKKPNEITIKDWHKIFSDSFPALFKIKDRFYRELSNFENYYEQQYASCAVWISLVNHLSDVFETLGQFKQLFTHDQLQEHLDSKSWEEKFSIKSSHFEIDLWADGYIIDYKHITIWKDKYILQVFWYFSLLRLITKNTDFKIKGIGILNTYTNSIFKLDIDPESKEIPSFAREEEQEKKIILSDEQNDIVKALPGPILINAGPGSGKTEVLGHRVKYLIEVEQTSPRDILLISFSNSAVEKLKEKIHSLIRDEDISREITISTFHKLAKDKCQAILRNRQNPLTLEIMTEKESCSFIKKITWLENSYAKDKLNIASKSITNSWYEDFIFWANHFMTKDCIPESNIQANIDEHDFYKLINDMTFNKLVYTSLLSKKEAWQELKKIFKEFSNSRSRIMTKQHRQAWMFDEWLAICLKEWKNRGPKKTYKYVFVDEFQDTNILQYSFLEKICTTNPETKSKNLCCIGDLDQSIFSFSGAFPEIFKKFWTDYQNHISIKKIQINRRSTKSIVAISKKLIRNIPIMAEFQKNIEPSPDKLKDYSVKWIKYLSHHIIVSQITQIIEIEFEKNLTRGPKQQFCLGEIAILSPKIGEYPSENYKFLSDIKFALNSWAQQHENKNLRNSKNVCQLIKNASDIIKDAQQHIMLRILHIGAFKHKFNQYPELFDSITEIMSLSSLCSKEKDQIEGIFFDYLKESKEQDFFDWYKKTKIYRAYDLISQIYECKKSIQINLKNLSYNARCQGSLSDCQQLLVEMQKIICQFGHFSSLSEMSSFKIKRIATEIIKQFLRLNGLYEVINKVMLGDSHYAKSFNNNQIQMMSIHKSKGKEFKYVFIVNLTWNSLDKNVSHQWLKSYKNKWEKQLGEGELELLNKIRDIATLDEAIKRIQDEIENATSENERNILEEKIKLYKIHRFNILEAIRTFYVGITRAEEHLYICSPPLDHTSLIHLISEDLEIIEDEGGEKFETKDKSAEDEDISWNISDDEFE